MYGMPPPGYGPLPGGYGTLDEFIEVVTWAQLHIHAKPCVLVNLRGFYDGLLSFLDRSNIVSAS